MFNWELMMKRSFGNQEAAVIEEKATGETWVFTQEENRRHKKTMARGGGGLH